MLDIMDAKHTILQDPDIHENDVETTAPPPRKRTKRKGAVAPHSDVVKKRTRLRSLSRLTDMPLDVIYEVRRSSSIPHTRTLNARAPRTATQHTDPEPPGPRGPPEHDTEHEAFPCPAHEPSVLEHDMEGGAWQRARVPRVPGRVERASVRELDVHLPLPRKSPPTTF